MSIIFTRRRRGEEQAVQSWREALYRLFRSNPNDINFIELALQAGVTNSAPLRLRVNPENHMVQL